MLARLPYVALGILSDLLVTGYYLSVARGWAWRASLASIPIALLNFYVLGQVLIVDASWQNAVAYAIGTAIGCRLIMAAAKGKK